jgi:hypothetical protein
MPLASAISITGQTIGGRFGLLFNSAWHDLDNAAESAFLEYQVTATTPGNYISSIHLDGDPTVTGIGQINVAEMVNDVPSHTSQLPSPGAIHIFNNSGVGVPNASSGVNGQWSVLDVETTIQMSADTLGTVTSMGHFQESFGQTSTPEPGTFALLGAGLLTAGGTLLRRRRSVK